MSGDKILRNVFTKEDLFFFNLWAIAPARIHRGNACDGNYYAEHDGKRKYDVWWTTQPPIREWLPLVKKIENDISELMDTRDWTIHAVDCITTRPASTKVHAHIDFPYKFAETENMTGVLGVQIIVPLDPFTVENGATIYMPGSSTLDLVTKDITGHQAYYNDHLLEFGEQFVADPGDVLMYDGKTLHSTMPNNSQDFRSALLINAIRNDALELTLQNDVNTDHSTRQTYTPE